VTEFLALGRGRAVLLRAVLLRADRRCKSGGFVTPGLLASSRFNFKNPTYVPFAMTTPPYCFGVSAAGAA
jgi:hypothetical protein